MLAGWNYGELVCRMTPACQNSRYEVGRGICVGPSVPVAGSNASAFACRSSQAASVNVGCAPTRSRIICHAARFNAPSGAGPIASETAHCGQKQIRRADDFCRGRTPVVWAKRNTATDFSPASSSRLQRRQNGLSNDSVRSGLQPRRANNVSKFALRTQVCRQIPADSLTDEPPSPNQAVL